MTQTAEIIGFDAPCFEAEAFEVFSYPKPLVEMIDSFYNFDLDEAEKQLERLDELGEEQLLILGGMLMSNTEVYSTLAKLNPESRMPEASVVVAEYLLSALNAVIFELSDKVAA